MGCPWRPVGNYLSAFLRVRPAPAEPRPVGLFARLDRGVLVAGGDKDPRAVSVGGAGGLASLGDVAVGANARPDGPTPAPAGSRARTDVEGSDEARPRSAGLGRHAGSIWATISGCRVYARRTACGDGPASGATHVVPRNGRRTSDRTTVGPFLGSASSPSTVHRGSPARCRSAILALGDRWTTVGLGGSPAASRAISGASPATSPIWGGIRHVPLPSRSLASQRDGSAGALRGSSRSARKGLRAALGASERSCRPWTPWTRREAWARPGAVPGLLP